MIKKYKFYVLVLSALASILFYGYAFAVDQESLETLRKISKMDKAEQKKLFEKVEQLEKGSIVKQVMEMRAYLSGLGVTADTFSNDKIRIEDFYKNKIIYEGGFLGDRKFEIPKAYISSYSHIIPDKETLSENSSIRLSYMGPDKRAKVEKLFTDASYAKVIESGRYTNLYVSRDIEWFNLKEDEFVRNAHPSLENNIFGLVAYKYSQIRPDNLHILYLEYKDGKIKSFMNCHWDFVDQESKKQCERDLAEGNSSVCNQKEINKSFGCSHIFSDKNISYALTFPFSDLKNWKQNRIDAIKFFNGFEVKTTDGSK